MNNQVSYKELPGQSKLFLDFIYNYPAVRAFYSSSSSDQAALRTCVQMVLKKEYPRKIIADTLHKQNTQFGSGQLALRNIDQITRPDTVVVVTGQQAGLFTGPIFTLYKALTAVKLSNYLNSAGINTVPIFWVASEDHDFAEIGKSYFIDTAGSLKKIEYELEGSQAGKSIGQIPITAQIEAKIQELKQTIPQTEFSGRIFDDISSSYAPGNTFSQAFARLLALLVKQHGLILFDPLDPAIKNLYAKILALVIGQVPDVNRLISKRNDELLSAGYQPQVKMVRANTPIFYSEDGFRKPIKITEENKLLLGNLELTRSDLIDRLKATPEKFTANVLLRPLIQDSLLPTAAYVGGPSEISYYAQVQPLYKFFDSVEPILTPRASFTILEKKIQKVLDKYALSPSDLFADLNSIFRKLVETRLNNDLATRFEGTEKSILENLRQLEEALGQFDPSLVGALAHSKEKIMYQIKNLRNKFISSSAKKNEIAKSQIEKTHTSIYPTGATQERVLNVFSFLIKYGYDLINRIYDEIDITSREHKIIKI